MSTTWVEWTISIRRSLQFVFLQLGFDLRGVADEKKFADVRIFAQRHHCTGTRFGGPKSPPMASKAIFIEAQTLRISAAHCKMKIVEASGALDRTSPWLTLAFDRQDLAAFIIPAGRADGVRLQPCCRIAGIC